MHLSDFPRPFDDTGIGIHWSMSSYWASQGQQDWGFWAEQVQAMGIKWAKIIDDGGGSGLQLANRLVDLGIMVVVRFYWPQQNPGNIGSRGMDAMREYIKRGVVYAEINNETDLDLEWKSYHKPDNWLDIVITNFIHDAYPILEAGGHVAVPAFGVGCLRNPYEAIVERGCKDILDGGAFGAVHNYALARPLEYPNDPVNLEGTPITQEEWEEAGGMWAWEMGVNAVNEARQKFKNPDATILTDATCFRSFEQVNHYVVQACGHSIPLLSTEGGYNVGQRGGTTFGDDPRYPKPTPQRTSELSLRMFKYMQGEELVLGKKVPPYFFAAMPWLIANYRMHVYQSPCEAQGPFYTHFFDEVWGLDGELPIVQVLKDLPPKVRQSGPVPTPWLVTKASDSLGDSWDSRLDFINVKYSPQLAEENEPVWRLVQADWLDETESNGQCSIFVKALDEDGNPLADKAFLVAREDATDVITTKGAVDGYWGNYSMSPDGPLGTYTVSMHGLSDAVVGVGHGVETPPHGPAPTSFRLVYQLKSGTGTTPVPTPVEPEPSPDVDDIKVKMRRLKDAWELGVMGPLNR